MLTTLGSARHQAIAKSETDLEKGTENLFGRFFVPDNFPQDKRKYKSVVPVFPLCDGLDLVEGLSHLRLASRSPVPAFRYPVNK